jgi:predicted nucleic acid-binding protein
MPLLENDVIFAYLNRADSYHDVARKLFYKLKNEEVTVEISSVSLLEMELVYKSRGIENRLLKDIAELIALPGAR